MLKTLMLLPFTAAYFLQNAPYRVVDPMPVMQWARCDKNEANAHVPRCDGVYCAAYKFAKCASEPCCKWVVELASDEHA